MSSADPRTGASDRPPPSGPRRRIDLAAIVIGLLIALTPNNGDAIFVGLLAGVVLLTIRWMLRRWRGEA